jgi:signal peptidase I
MMQMTGVADGVRSQARWRSHFWPGSGFALLGHPALALIGTTANILVAVSLLCLAIAFRRFLIWSFLASVAFGICFYIAEQIMCRSIAIRAAEAKRFSPRLWIALCGLGYAGFIGVLVVFFWNLGSLQVAGQGMTPTLQPGDLLLYKKHVYPEDLRRGHFVYFRTSADSAWRQGGDLVVARILAMPGDEMSIEGDHYVLNGGRTMPLSPLGEYRPSLEIPKAPKALRVPAGCYFVVQDNPEKSFDSRVLSWAREPDLVATRAIMLVGRRFAEEVE